MNKYVLTALVIVGVVGTLLYFKPEIEPKFFIQQEVITAP